MEFFVCLSRRACAGVPGSQPRFRRAHYRTHQTLCESPSAPQPSRPSRPGFPHGAVGKVRRGRRRGERRGEFVSLRAAFQRSKPFLLLLGWRAGKGGARGELERAGCRRARWSCLVGALRRRAGRR